MPNTLGLDDDLDGVEFVRDLERIFDVEVSNSEAESISTVGELCDLLVSKIPTNDVDRKCATAMAFFRLRGALRRLGYEHALTPTSKMLTLKCGGTKSLLRRLQKELDLRLPDAVPTRIGCAASLCCFFVVLSGVFSLQPGVPSALLGSLFGLFAASAVIIHVDPGQLPRNCRTLGDLAQKTAALNYGRLIKMGARHDSDDIWENLVEALSRYALPKAEITRETYFLRSQLKKNLAA
jgi:hypothetical protein